MSKKRYCDVCEKDITNDVIFEVMIYDEILEKELTRLDLCEKHKKVVRIFLLDLIKSKGKKE